VEDSVRFLVLGPVAVERDGFAVSLGPKLLRKLCKQLYRERE